MNFVIFFLVPVAYTYSDILLFIPHLDDTFCVVFFLIYLSKGLSSLIFIFKERTLALLIFSMAFFYEFLLSSVVSLLSRYF